MAGYNVCPEHSFGDVNTTNGAHVILDGESDVLLDKQAGNRRAWLFTGGPVKKYGGRQ